jgi:hypothetical protein
VLDYIVTSNHIHLLVKDTGATVIAESVQFIRIPQRVSIVPAVQPLRLRSRRFGLRLRVLSGFADLQEFQTAHRQSVEQGLATGLAIRDDRWSEAIAVGSRPLVEKVKGEIGLKATYREVIKADGTYALREVAQTYGLKFAAESEAPRSQNTVFWDETVDEVRT